MAILKKQSLVDQIYDQIRYEIIHLSMPLGGRLNVSELQERYGVSSTPIREAVNRLQKEGLVEYENNVGARIVAIHEADVTEIQELAMTLHIAAVKFAMKRGDHKAMAEEIKKEIGNYKSAGDFIARTMSVHNIIGTFYRYCGNSRLDSNMIMIQGLQLILRNIYGRAQENRGKDAGESTNGNVQDFMDIYDAVLDGDTDRIIRTLEANEAKATPIIIQAVQEMNESK